MWQVPGCRAASVSACLRRCRRVRRPAEASPAAPGKRCGGCGRRCPYGAHSYLPPVWKPMKATRRPAPFPSGPRFLPGRPSSGGESWRAPGPWAGHPHPWGGHLAQHGLGRTLWPPWPAWRGQSGSAVISLDIVLSFYLKYLFY